jgi:hypothetical protein
MKEAQAMALGIDPHGSAWVYTFATFDEASDFVSAVDFGEAGWMWDVRLVYKERSVAEAIEDHKQAIGQ